MSFVGLCHFEPMAFYIYDVLQSIAIIILFNAQITPFNWPQCPLDMTSLVLNSFLANTISYPRLILYNVCPDLELAITPRN